MKNRYKILIYAIIPLFIFSCTDRIDIRTEDAKPALSIFGYITNDTTVHSIKITRTTGYFASETPRPISNAEVTLSDGEHIFQLKEDMEFAGVYSTNYNFYGEEGKTYTLDIKLDFDNDGQPEHYQAKSIMPYATVVDSVILRPSLFIPNLLLYGKISDKQTNNLAVYLTKNNEPKTAIEYFMILPDYYVKGNDIQGAEFPCLLDSIQQGDTISFKVSSFTGEFANFMSHARSETGFKNPIFSGPPANVETNIVALDPGNEAPIVGFFSAFSSNEASTISDRDYIFGQR